MVAADLAQRVKELELHTRKMLLGSRIGASRSLHKGSGFEFDQLRSYQYGDDVRLIDWKSSARMPDSLLVRQYFEERNRTFMICVDVSASTMFGSGQYTKQEMMQQVAGVLALAGQWSGDKVGLILYSDQIECMIPPVKGYAHVHNLITTLFSHHPKGQLSDLSVLTDFVAAHLPKRAVVLVVSDFIDVDIKKSFKSIAFSKELIAIQCLDRNETTLPNVGYVWMKDPETGQIALVHSASGANMNNLLQQRAQSQLHIAQSLGVDFVWLNNQETFMHDLIQFFQKRMMN